jgi:type I restriction enzyme S subunit
MNTDLVTDHLDLWTSAVTYNRGQPELTGIAKLRELILELAVRGKIVPQDPEDEPASVLLERIEAEKERLYKEGEIKKPKKLPDITEVEKPFSLPDRWVWARLPEIASYSPGKTPSTKEDKYWISSGGTPWASIADLRDGGVVEATSKHVTEDSIREVFKEKPVEPGAILMSFKLTLGKISINRVPVFHNEAIISSRPFPGVDLRYLFKALPKRAREGNSKSAIKGETLNQKSLSELLVPIPPFSEQERIVDKIDELMALCDRLEQQTSDQLSDHETLLDTLLNTLTRSQDATDLADNWARLAEHFDSLFTTEHSIDRLEQTILQLAVMGRLVHQDPNDEPASKLLERIEEEKERLYKEGKVKKPKKHSEVAEEENLFTIPHQWKWIGIGDFSQVKGGKRLPKGHVLLDTPTKYKYIRVSDMKGGSVKQDDIRYISEKTFDAIKSYTISSDDIYVTIAGTIGSVGEIPSDLDGANLTENAAKVVFPVLNRKFVKYALSSEYVQDQFLEKVNQMAQPKLALHRIESSLFALPPLSEQKRIVEKIDELMALCERLKSNLNEAGATQQRLAESLVKQAVA